MKGLSMWWDRSRTGTKQGRHVIAEAERLLAGRTVQSYVRGAGRAPAWTLVGVLGHCSRGELERVAAPSALPDPGGWSGAVAYLAEQMLAQTTGEADLVRLQRRSLVPLELDLLGGKLRPPRTPTDLYALIIGALQRPLSPEI
jgi:hypothetical protein